MPLKPLIQGLAVIWVVLFLASFASLQVVESDDFASVLNRVASFLTWQTIAFAVAALGALLTRHAVGRGVQTIKLVGYGPLAVSVFLVASFVAIVGVRFFIVPLFETA
jgi:hypothetical protein